ncbi:MAG: glycosyltransferase [Armatimonadetes bacterium]|nr:glycosyltransferase [Armatimonadota bacterium]
MPSLFWIYLAMCLIAALNWLWMTVPRRKGEVNFEVMIPARNEAENLPDVLPPLVGAGVQVTVFDDESTDGTAEVAESMGAKVVRPDGPLPAGWTGKNRACHELALVANADWVVFLDADTKPSDDFAERLAGGLADAKASVVTGFTRMVPGAGIEPAYLAWVPWILLATNPFGLVAITRKGHNHFTNGQFTAWKLDRLREVRPHETLLGEVLEDVKIGRLLARRGIAVGVWNVAPILGVQMYKTLPEAFAGMSKNSCDIMGSVFASVILALGLIFLAWAWVLFPSHALLGYGLLVLNMVLTGRVVRTPIWTVIFAPLTITAAAVTILWSTMKRQKGGVQWKGRTYGG